MRWVVSSVIGVRSSASTRSAFRRRGATCALPQARAATFRHGASTRAIESRWNLLTVALLGYDGGEIVRRGLADCALVVRSDYIPRIQEVQASIYHVVRELL